MHVALGVSRIRFNIPLGPAYLAAALKGAGHRVSLFQFDWDTARSIRALAVDPPGFVSYSVLSGEHRTALRFHQRLRRVVPLPSVWGGPHPTHHPEFLLEDGVDAVCRGEGEESLTEFADRFATGREMPTDVRNFWVRTPDGVTRNPLKPLVQDLDRLPIPDRRPFVEVNPYLRRHGIRHFMARRGCSHGCTFCFNRAYRKLYGDSEPTVRTRSPGNVIAEIQAVREDTPLEMVAFVDDSFAQDIGWLRTFSGTYRDSVRLPYSCNLRADDCTPEAVSLLAASGCRLAYVGVESGDRRLRLLLGRPMAERTIREAMGALRRAGIRTITENMVGIPGERFSEALETLRLNIEVRPTFANCSYFTPYPGLPLTRHAVREGWFDGDFGKLGKDYYRTSPLEFPSRTEKDRIVNLRCFFSFLVRHPGALPYVKWLLSIPPNPAIRTFGKLFDGYGLGSCIPYEQRLARKADLAWMYLRMYR